MIIKKYGDIPAAKAPDVHEVVLARLSATDEYTLATVLAVRRRGRTNLEIKVQWLRSYDPGEGRVPVIKGAVGWVTTSVDGWPPKIKQISRDQARKLLAASD